jgi:hypothetical protein
MPKYVIHVGPHKTGSTYLQLSFHDMHEFLAGHGVLYPKRWYISPSSPNHLPLFSRLLGGGDEQLSRDFAELNSSKFQHILISAEDLSDLPIAGLDVLRVLIGNSDLTIVFYCRRWSETLPSVWQEWIKQGQSFSFPEYCFREIENSENTGVINLAIKLDKLTSVFGFESMRLVSYSNLLDDRVDILEHFMRTFLSITEFPIVTNKRVNASLSLMDTEIIRLLNSLEWIVHRRRGSTMRNQYLENRNYFNLQTFEKAVSENIAHFRIDDASPRFASLHDRLYDKFGKSLVNPIGERRQLFNPRGRDIPYVGPDYVLLDGVAEEIRAVYKHVAAMSQSRRS